MIDFEGQVVIVTGAGGGIGREHALEFGRRGAKVVVNDLGGDVAGQGHSAMAESVVNEIKSAGGKAMADGSNVTSAESMDDLVQRVIDRWGRIDVLVANAGILRDKTFAKVSVEDFLTVVNVHLTGTMLITRAVWPHMREQAYGRIVMTTSSSGLYGNFGQANYGAAKMGIVGLMNVLRLEGAKYDIRVNAVAPIAGTRMTDSLMGEEGVRVFDPKLVTPAVICLADQDAPNGQIISAGAGAFARTAIIEGRGVYLGSDVQAEALRDHWEDIVDTTEHIEPQHGGEQGAKIRMLMEEAATAKRR